MADTPLVYTSDEQLKLQELDRQVNGFTLFKNLVAKSLYLGQDAALAHDLLNFLSNLVNQSSVQIQQLQAAAKARASQPAESAPSEGQ